MNTRITKLFDIRYPIVSGGMVWCSGNKLVSAVSNAGGLGLLGAGSMYPEVLREHIRKVKSATRAPFGVNVPLMYPEIDRIMEVIMEEHVPIVFTSAGNPKTWTRRLQEEGIKVAHVVSSTKFALKSQDAGVDAVVAEGFEAGGHNGREETTTICLVPAVVKTLEIPVIAAGGISSGAAMAAAICLGAEGVQIGSAFALSLESSAHPLFKERCLEVGEGGTKLLLKKLSPTRLVENSFMKRVEEAEERGASSDELREMLGKGRAKQGIFLGDLEEGELEIGQCVSMIQEVKSVHEIISNLVEEYEKVIRKF